MSRALAWFYGRPYLLLTLTMLMWGGNAVASRLAVGAVSPLTFTFLRWTIPVAILGVALRSQLLAHRFELIQRWPMVLLMGTLGLTVFNALMYVAAHCDAAGRSLGRDSGRSRHPDHFLLQPWRRLYAARLLPVRRLHGGAAQEAAGSGSGLLRS